MRPYIFSLTQIIFKRFLFAGLLLFSSLSSSAQESSIPDEAVMKSYFFVMLTKGENRNQDSATAAHIQKGHLENIGRLAKEGKIDIAGPFLDDTEWRGIFIFNVESESEVKALLDTDPAIQSGRLGYIIHPWYSLKGSVLR